MNRQSFLAGVLVALLIGAGGWYYFRDDPFRNARHVRELATRGLGAYLASAFPGQRVLVLSNPFTQRPGTAAAILEAEAAGLRGLRQGLGTATPVAAVVFPELKPDALNNPRALLTDRESTTPLSFLVAPHAFDQACKEHSDCGVVVSLIGLPFDLGRVECWQKPGAPRFGLLLPDLPLLGGAAALEQAVRSGKLAAFVLAKPGAPSADAPMGGGWQTEFERRFLLVTPQNFDQMRQAYPGLFPRR